MRRRPFVTMFITAVLLVAGGVVAYQRVSALTCSTPAYTAWVGEGDRGPGACLLYVALAPDTPPVRQPQARGEPVAVAPAPSPSPAPPAESPMPTASPSLDSSDGAASSSSVSAPATDEASTYQYVMPDGEAIATGTCEGQAFDYWQEVARFYGDDPSCQTYVDEIAKTASEVPEMVQPGPSFRSSGETQQYYLLLEEETDWD